MLEEYRGASARRHAHRECRRGLRAGCRGKPGLRAALLLGMAGRENWAVDRRCEASHGRRRDGAATSSSMRSNVSYASYKRRLPQRVVYHGIIYNAKGFRCDQIRKKVVIRKQIMRKNQPSASNGWGRIVEGAQW